MEVRGTKVYSISPITVSTAQEVESTGTGSAEGFWEDALSEWLRCGEEEVQGGGSRDYSEESGQCRQGSGTGRARPSPFSDLDCWVVYRSQWKGPGKGNR